MQSFPSTPLAATAAPIHSVLPCGETGTVGGLGAGTVSSRLILPFNKSDGQDRAGILAAGSTISIGGGTLYSIRTTTPGRVLWPAAK